jgi:hypothetical protein
MQCTINFFASRWILVDLSLSMKWVNHRVYRINSKAENIFNVVKAASCGDFTTTQPNPLHIATCYLCEAQITHGYPEMRKQDRLGNLEVYSKMEARSSFPSERCYSEEYMLLQWQYCNLNIHHHKNVKSSLLTLSLSMSYIYGAPCKARNFNVYIWTYVWQRWKLSLFAAQCFNIESVQKVFLCHSCV